MKIYKGLWGVLAALALTLLWTTPAQASAAASRPGVNAAPQTDAISREARS